MSEMGGIESFAGAESSEGIDQAALERLRERMKAAAAQAKRDQKREAKQKQTEGNLAQVLIAFLQKQQQGLIRVVTRAIDANIPAFFIIAVLALRFKAVRKEVGLEINVDTEKLTTPENESTSLVPANFTNQGQMPLHIKLEMNIWLQFLIDQSRLEPHKLLKSLHNKDAAAALINLISYIIQDFLQVKQVEFNGQNILAFSQNFVTSLEQYLSDYTAKQGQIGEGAEESTGESSEE